MSKGVGAALLCLGLLGAGGAGLWQSRPAAQPLLLAPMIGGLEPCLFAPDEGTAPGLAPTYAASCSGPNGSAAAQVVDTLARLGANSTSDAPRWTLGYTLNVPLLKLLAADGAGWSVDETVVRRIARTIRDADRPVVLYLFANHFGVGAPAEATLATDSSNLLQTPQGPLPKDRYYGLIDIHAWSFVDTRNGITRAREQAMQAVLDEVCRLPDVARRQVRAVTVLGELHHMFPDFQAGMGFDGRYLITDYSPASVRGFQAYLQARFGHIAALNRATGAQFASFQAVQPPSRDIRHESLRDFTEHLDAYAHGRLPVTGWVHVPGAAASAPPQVRIYLDGERLATVSARMSRQDVLEARPQFGTANVGWTFDLDYATLAPGLHRLDVYLEQAGHALQHLGTRRVAVMDASRRPPQPHLLQRLPAATPPHPDVSFHLDHPRDLADVYFNPLVPLWHAFRTTQVQAYLAHFQQIVARSCLGPQRVYSHQILPFTNPDWDTRKFAVGDSLGVPPDMALGVSLYGEASYGASFPDWLRHSRRRQYGVTEFHPLRPMTPDELAAVWERHRMQGAQFLSFFIAAQGADDGSSNGSNLFAFDPANPKFGSDRLYSAVQTLLGR